MRSIAAIKLLLTVYAFVICLPAMPQDSTSILHLPGRAFNRINAKAQRLESHLHSQTERYLKRLEKQEEKLYKKLGAKDSTAAAELFGDIKERYSKLRQQLQAPAARLEKLNEYYSPHLDSISTALHFFNQDNLSQLEPEVKQKMQTALASYSKLKQGFSAADDIKKYIRQRQQLLQSRLLEFGMVKDMRQFKKQAYYYKAQIEEYKKLLNDPSAMQKKIMQLATKTSLFKNFFSKYSQLATLFNLQTETGTFASLQGLQTRAQTQQLLQQRVGPAGMNVQQAVQTNIANAQSAMQQLKEKLNNAGKGNSDEQMPDFKPNYQKTKIFLDRLEFGSNLQTTHTTAYFPSTADIGLSIGYKLNDKSIIGIGGSYKLGVGRGWNKIAFTHEGIGLRSFADLKLKGSFWITGGGELNYRSQFRDLSILNNYNAWQKSALLGLSKKYNIGKKMKGNAQLLYDFLYRQQAYAAQPVLFRLGYNLNGKHQR